MKIRHILNYRKNIALKRILTVEVYKCWTLLRDEYYIKITYYSKTFQGTQYDQVSISRSNYSRPLSINTCSKCSSYIMKTALKY